MPPLLDNEDDDIDYEPQELTDNEEFLSDIGLGDDGKWKDEGDPKPDGNAWEPN